MSYLWCFTVSFNFTTVPARWPLYRNSANMTQYVQLRMAKSRGKKTLENLSMLMARTRFLCAGAGLGGAGACPVSRRAFSWNIDGSLSQRSGNGRFTRLNLPSLQGRKSCLALGARLGIWGRRNRPGRCSPNSTPSEPWTRTCKNKG